MSKEGSQNEGCSSGSCPSGSQGSPKMAMGIQDKIIEDSLGRIRHKILVMSGKGGVGKSSIAANIAVGLANRGHKVGLMDVDLHGPSIAKIMGIDGLLDVTPENWIIPASHGANLGVVSMQAFMPDKDHAVIWRGPAKAGVIRQFIADVQWGDLDFLVIDSPPGTGDEPLTVAQMVKDALAVVVATPQEVALADVRKSINFCTTVNMKILGLVENMGAFKCPHCNEIIELYPCGGGEITAKQAGIPYLGSIPFDPEVVKACDAGRPIMDFDSPTTFTTAMSGILDTVESQTVKAEK
ncbi:MAG: P-loop NTPase [Desulfatibacillaceae bacterium]